MGLQKLRKQLVQRLINQLFQAQMQKIKRIYEYDNLKLKIKIIIFKSMAHIC